MLLDQLLLRHRQAVAQQEVLEGVPVEDVVHVEGVVLDVEIEPVLAGAQAVERLTAPLEPPQGLPRVLEVRGLQAADGLNDLELRSVSSLFNSRMACSEKVT